MKKIILCGFMAIVLFAACEEKAKKENHFLTDANYREQVNKQFEVRKKMAENRSDALFGVFNKDLTTEQREALMFLYAYMPLNDLADYDGEFFLKHVDAAFATREAFDWGKTIPEDIFRHFVLPYRVNNENMDTARMVFLKELQPRLKGMSMYDAALEVNHWCHEKVTYQPTDSRTSAPLSTIRTAWGRCGEESTFTVTALRAAGIPARQVYTPRWAHTDDNHAWVEVWIDGKWYYLGACEPEPELNMAWFTAPAKRAMMVHTNVFGEYSGPEETLIKTHIYSKVNQLDIYAPVKDLVVNVVDTDNKPVENARVEYKLYNYAEFYNLATKYTDAEGKTSLTTGKGSLLVWATDGKKYGYEIVDVYITDIVGIMLDKVQGEEYTEDIDIAPPAPLKIDEVSSEKERENNRRLKQEDSIRGAYEATFPKRDYSDQLAKRLGLDAGKTWKAIEKSYGNWREIEKFMEQHKDNKRLFDLLNVIADKDLRDTPAEILADHIENVADKGTYPDDIFVRYVLSPRVRNEMIGPWRGFVKGEVLKYAPDMSMVELHYIVDWVKQNIKINEDDSYYNCPITPIGVYDLRIADKASRDIFFVAVCRGLDIAARIDPATGVPQVYEGKDWKNIVFEAQQKSSAGTATLNIANSPKNTITPRYGTHFSIARYVDGDFVTLNYRGSTFGKFPASVKLDDGYYRLTVGNRADDGSVLAGMTYFALKDGETKNVTVELRPIVKSFEKKGEVSLNHKLKKLDDGAELDLQKLAAGKGLVLVFLDPAREPSRHVMNDIPVQRAELEKWGGNILFVLPSDKNDNFNPQYKNLPKQSVFAIDENREVMKSLFSDMKTDFIGDFPATWLITPQGDVVFMWQGYRIGIGEDLVKAIAANKLK